MLFEFLDLQNFLLDYVICVFRTLELHMNNVNGFSVRYFRYLVYWIFDHSGINNLVFSVFVKFDAFRVPYFSYIYSRFYIS